MLQHEPQSIMSLERSKRWRKSNNLEHLSTMRLEYELTIKILISISLKYSTNHLFCVDILKNKIRRKNDNNTINYSVSWLTCNKLIGTLVTYRTKLSLNKYEGKLG